MQFLRKCLSLISFLRVPHLKLIRRRKSWASSSVNVRLGPSFSRSATTATEWQRQKKIGCRGPIKNSVYLRYRGGSRRTLIYVRRCNICAACAKRRRRGDEGGRPCRVSPSCSLPTVAKERCCVSPFPSHTKPRFSYVVSTSVRQALPPTPSPSTRREREPPPLYGSAGGGGGVVSWPPWRAALSTYSHPRLTSSPSPLRFLFSLFPTWPHAPSIFLPPTLSRSPSFSLLDMLPASVYPDFSPTHSPHRPP